MSRDWSEAFSWTFQHCRKRDEFVGQSLADAEKTARADQKTRDVRIWALPSDGSNVAMTTEMNPYRLNLLVDEGVAGDFRHSPGAINEVPQLIDR